jgi:polysaccharide export outer membrane protein
METDSLCLSNYARDYRIDPAMTFQTFVTRACWLTFLSTYVLCASDAKLDMFREFEPNADEPYRLAPGDEFLLDSLDHPELAGRHVVGPDGNVSIPLAGSILVAEKTSAEASAVIRESLRPFYTRIAAQVRIEKYSESRVLVLGKIARPGVVGTAGVPTLLDVLSKANPVMGGGSPAKLPAKLAIFRGSESVVWIELRQLAESGNRLANMRLRRNDVIYVPDDQDEFVSVLGDVNNPGVVSLSQSSTVLGVLARAGGIRDGGDDNKIQILRANTGEVISVRLRDLLYGARQSEILLRAGDAMYVPRSGFAKFSSALQRISPVSSILMFGAILAN